MGHIAPGRPFATSSLASMSLWREQDPGSRIFKSRRNSCDWNRRQPQRQNSRRSTCRLDFREISTGKLLHTFEYDVVDVHALEFSNDKKAIFIRAEIRRGERKEGNVQGTPLHVIYQREIAPIGNGSSINITNLGGEAALILPGSKLARRAGEEWEFDELPRRYLNPRVGGPVERPD